MITLPDLQRYLNPIRRKLFLLVGKALLTAVNNEGKVGYYDSEDRKNPQRVSCEWLGNLTDIEHPQPYGHEAYPIAETAENLIVCPDGSRSNAFVIMVQDDEYRPIDGDEGDVIDYGKNDKTDGEKHRVHFKNDGSVEIWAGKTNKIVIGHDGDIDIEAKTDCNITVGGNAVVNVTGDATTTVGGATTIDTTGITTVKSGGNVDVQAATVTTNCDVLVTGGDVVADGISLKNHYHQGNLGYPTGISIMTGGGSTPGTPPTSDASGDVVTGTGTSLDDHVHSGVTEGEDNSGPPV